MSTAEWVVVTAVSLITFGLLHVQSAPLLLQMAVMSPALILLPSPSGRFKRPK